MPLRRLNQWVSGLSLPFCAGPVLILGLLSSVSPPLDAATPTSALEVRRAAGEIRLDGDLTDPGWRGAAVIDRFWETQPGDNVAPRVATRVWVTYDQSHLYIGFRCEDPDPSSIRAPFVERDKVYGTDDNVAVFLDTRGDGLTALELRVSPRGQQGDAVFSDASRNEDFAPDVFYDTAARITEFGWAAEMRIPFSSLRYSGAREQAWTILVWRNFPREYRYAFHSRPIPRGSDCWICHAQPMTGLSDLPRSGGLVLAPYAAAQEVAEATSPGEPLDERDRDGRAGLDVKWQPAAGHAIDATLNPDFSQVESDVAQIAVNNRFALFFEERRPFFMEGVELFDTPIPAVYTRTITLPRWGGRATGRLGSTSYAALASDDRGGGSVILPGPTGSGLAPQDFRSQVGIARVRQDFGGSYVGALYTDRELEDGGFNRVLGPDLLWRLSSKDRVSAQLLWSETRTPNRPDLAEEWDGRRLSGHGLQAYWTHEERHPFGFVQYDDFADGFRADTGFVPQVGYRRARGRAAWTFYPQGLLTTVIPRLDASYAEDRQGWLIERAIRPGVFVHGRRNLAALVNVALETERTGQRLLSTTATEIFLQVDPSQRFTRIGLDARIGDTIDLANEQVGTGVDMTLTATLRPWSRLTLDLVGGRRWLDTPRTQGGKGRLFTADVARIRALFHFDARAYVRVIGQWVGTRRDPELYPYPVEAKSADLEASVLFAYRLNWQTALFVGYGDVRALDPRNDLRPASRQLFAKISYAFQR